MKLHKDIYFDECIPAYLTAPDPDFFNDCDPGYFGKADILGLAHFWKAREDKFRFKSFHEPSLLKSRDCAREADLCESKNRYLRSLASRAEVKPAIFTKPTVHLNERVVFFVENPDRYLTGALTRIIYDEETETGSFTIRAFDSKTGKTEGIVYEPNGFSIFPEEYFIYFRKHPEYFRIYLKLNAWGFADQLKAERMLATLPAPPPPEAA